MAEEFQALLDRLNNEYLAQAEARKAEIIGTAEKEAASIIEAAKAEAEKLCRTAEKDAAAARERSEAAARQAARDIVLGLKEELSRRLEHAVGKAAGEALTPEFMVQVLKDMAAAEHAETAAVLTSLRDAEAVKKLLKGTLAASFKALPEIFPSRNIHAGMQVAFNGQDLYADLTDSAVCELLKSHLGAELGRLLDEK